MAGALQGFGTPIGYPSQGSWGQPWGAGAGMTNLPGQQFFGQQLGQSGTSSPFGGTYLPQQLQSLQAAVQQLQQIEHIQLQHVQQLLQIVPLQLQQIQHLLQFVLQQPYQSQLYGQQSFLPTAGFPQFGGQGCGPQAGYVPPTGYVM